MGVTMDNLPEVERIFWSYAYMYTLLALTPSMCICIRFRLRLGCQLMSNKLGRKFGLCDMNYVFHSMKHQQSATDDRPRKSRFDADRRAGERHPVLSAHLASRMRPKTSTSGAGPSSRHAHRTSHRSEHREQTPALEALLVAPPPVASPPPPPGTPPPPVASPVVSPLQPRLEQPAAPPTAPPVEPPAAPPAALPAAPPPAPPADAPANIVVGNQDNQANNFETFDIGLNIYLGTIPEYIVDNNLDIVWMDTRWITFSGPEIRLDITEIQRDLRADGGKVVGAFLHAGRTRLVSENERVILYVEKSVETVAIANAKLTAMVFSVGHQN